MTRDPHWCPVCDYGGGESLASVRSHINAETSEGHDWNRLRDRVHDQEQGEGGEEQREAGETTPSEQAEPAPEGAGSDASDDEEAESDGEQAEGAENSPSEQPENGSEMATPEEYQAQQQQQQADSSDEGTDEGDPSGDSPTGEDSNTQGGAFPAPSTRTVLLVVGAVAVAAVLYYVVLEDDATQSETGTFDEEDDQEDSSEQAATQTPEDFWDE